MDIPHVPIGWRRVNSTSRSFWSSMIGTMAGHQRFASFHRGRTPGLEWKVCHSALENEREALPPGNQAWQQIIYPFTDDFPIQIFIDGRFFMAIYGNFYVFPIKTHKTAWRFLSESSSGSPSGPRIWTASNRGLGPKGGWMLSANCWTLNFPMILRFSAVHRTCLIV